MVNNITNINKTNKVSLNSDGKNFININKTNNESLNSDGQQFHQYQRNKQGNFKQ